MRNVLLISAMVMLALLFSSCESSKEVSNRTIIKKAVWQYSPVTVDGNDSEWTSPLLFSVARQPIDYAITNDDDNVYIVLKSSNKIIMEKIVYNGIATELWIGNHSKETLSLQYPLAQNPMMEKIVYTKNRTATKNTDIYSLKTSGGESRLHFVKEKGTTGIQLQIGMNNRQEMVYEAKIPFSTFCEHTSTSTNRSEILHVRLCIWGFEKSSFEESERLYKTGASPIIINPNFSRNIHSQTLIIRKKIPIAMMREAKQ